MSNYLTTDTDLIAVADAIRAKGGTSSSLSFPDGYVSAIQNIQTGGNLEDITINQNYLVKQNTVISNGIIFQTDETYPGTSVVLDNATYANINNGDLGENGIGIKIDLNKTYHCTGELKIEWSTGEQEIYSIDTDFTPANYSVNNLSFSWEGIGISTQTFNYVYLNFVSSAANGYKIFMRPTTGGSTGVTKSGVLLDGSYYQISVTSDGFNTINLNLSDDPRFQAIYKSLAYRSIIASSAPGVSEWCDSLSSFKTQQFAGQPFSGDFTFNNIKTINYYAFGSVNTGTYTGNYGYFGLNFPSCSSIYDAAFISNQYLRSVSFPECTSIGNYAFLSCSALTTISFPNCAIIGNSAFQSCTSLTTISFPECITITSYAFYACNNLTSVFFPNCTSIREHAFQNCRKLITISFPECITISSYAFQYCSALTTVNFPKCMTIDSQIFPGCINLTTASFPECTTIGGLAFQSCSALTTANFPNCTTIGSSAFQGCFSLSNISFLNCSTINMNAFQSCSALTTANFPNCTTIGNSAFYNCSALTTANFPSCTSIGSYAFYSCSNLISMSFPLCTTISGGGTFVNCTALQEAYFPECTLISGQYAFRNCTSLLIISFPKVSSISAYAFSDCKSLESAYFMGSSIPLIGAGIFTNTPMVNATYLGYFGSIYVPASLLASYKTAQYWSQYSARMVGI